MLTGSDPSNISWFSQAATFASDYLVSPVCDFAANTAYNVIDYGVLPTYHNVVQPIASGLFNYGIKPTFSYVLPNLHHLFYVKEMIGFAVHSHIALSVPDFLERLTSEKTDTSSKKAQPHHKSLTYFARRAFQYRANLQDLDEQTHDLIKTLATAQNLESTISNFSKPELAKLVKAYLKHNEKLRDDSLNLAHVSFMTKLYQMTARLDTSGSPIKRLPLIKVAGDSLKSYSAYHYGHTNKAREILYSALSDLALLSVPTTALTLLPLPEWAIFLGMIATEIAFAQQWHKKLGAPKNMLLRERMQCLQDYQQALSEGALEKINELEVLLLNKHHVDVHDIELMTMVEEKTVEQIGLELQDHLLQGVLAVALNQDLSKDQQTDILVTLKARFELAFNKEVPSVWKLLERFNPEAYRRCQAINGDVLMNFDDTFSQDSVNKIVEQLHALAKFNPEVLAFQIDDLRTAIPTIAVQFHLSVALKTSEIKSADFIAGELRALQAQNPAAYNHYLLAFKDKVKPQAKPLPKPILIRRDPRSSTDASKAESSGTAKRKKVRFDL